MTCVLLNVTLILNSTLLSILTRGMSPQWNWVFSYSLIEIRMNLADNSEFRNTQNRKKLNILREPKINAEFVKNNPFAIPANQRPFLFQTTSNVESDDNHHLNDVALSTRITLTTTLMKFLLTLESKKVYRTLKSLKIYRVWSLHRRLANQKLELKKSLNYWKIDNFLLRASSLLWRLTVHVEISILGTIERKSFMDERSNQRIKSNDVQLTVYSRLFPR